YRCARLAPAALFRHTPPLGANCPVPLRLPGWLAPRTRRLVRRVVNSSARDGGKSRLTVLFYTPLIFFAAVGSRKDRVQVVVFVFGWDSLVPIGLAHTIGRRALTRALFRVGLVSLMIVAGGGAVQDATADGQTRTLSFHHSHSGEDLTVTFKRNGRYDE